MIARVRTFAFEGIKAISIDVEVKITGGMAAFYIVGLPDKAVAESRERVRAALNSLELELPGKRITVNLAPADIVKEGSHYDLPIALGLLVEMGVIPQEVLDHYGVMGELSLDGNINAVNGVLPAAVEANALQLGIICPYASAKEAVWAGGALQIIAAKHLLQLLNHLRGRQLLDSPDINDVLSTDSIMPKLPDMAEVKGQHQAKRALEIAAAGGHNVLMIGSPGVGKSMLAARLPSILPRPTLAEILEINMLASVAGKLQAGHLSECRPYRAPHHSCSMAAMVGGGSKAKPGEVSLAHRGVLFLDEFAEFPRAVLDALRQPLENGTITLSRANSHVTYPANFQLIAAMNPCRCGYAYSQTNQCQRYPKCVAEYQQKISGPLMERIDLYVMMSEHNTFYAPGTVANTEETSATILARVEQARTRQYSRYAAYGVQEAIDNTNATVTAEILEKSAEFSPESVKLLQQAAIQENLSMRSCNRILRVARTIADLAQQEQIQTTHLLEALAYRQPSQLSHKITENIS